MLPLWPLCLTSPISRLVPAPADTPPVVQVLFYLRPEGFDWVPSTRRGCLQPSAVLGKGQWARALWAPWLHADALHLYYNLSSLLLKVSLGACWACATACQQQRQERCALARPARAGSHSPGTAAEQTNARTLRPQGGQLEPRLGLLPFARLVAELALVSNALYLAAAAALVRMAPALGWPLWRGCAVGFSGVLFGMKVRRGWEGQEGGEVRKEGGSWRKQNQRWEPRS